ncbi:MAG: pyruvate formate lyase family protein, partial [Armatimonadetes bacterium]|nr:pyruvate formate lyase family protein [Armatimonadota bacterium]
MAIETLPSGSAGAAIDPMIAFAQEFTECYRAHAGAHRAVREAMCLRVQFPRLLRDLAGEDTFAGRVPKPSLVAFSHHIWGTFPERTSAGKQGGYCFDFGASARAGQTEAERAIVAELEAFWATECGNAKFRAKWDSEMHTYVQFAPSDTPTGHLPGGGFMVGGGSNGCSITLEFGRLLGGGIPGLVALVEAKRASVHAAGGDTGFHDGLALALQLLIDVCAHYERQARDLAASAADAATRERMSALAEVMAAITQRPPRTLREALQLAWIYTIVNADLAEFPRFDELFGGFYAHDVDSGACTPQEADELLAALWRHMARDGSPFSDRIVVGGRGRVNERDADRLALAVLRTARAHRDVTPQFTMRHCQGQAPELMAAALDALGDGCSFPLLYNDDAILPGVERSLNVSPETALRYHPFGCGEYTLAGGSPTPILVGFNVPKALEAVLHNGRNVHGELIGLTTGELGEFDTFERLYNAFEQQVAFALGLAAKTYRRVYAALAEECSFLLASLLTDDCLERGRAALDGGLHRMGACVVGQGYTNTADALTA